MRPAFAAAAAAAISAAVCSGCTSGSSDGSGAPSASVITSTTQIAGAGVLGNQRRPDESCAPEPAGAGCRAGDADRPQRGRGRAGHRRGSRRSAAHRRALRRPARRPVRAGPAVADRRGRAAGRLVGSAVVSGHGRAQAAGRRHPQQPRPGRDQGRQAGPDPRLAGPDAEAVFGTGRHRADGVHRVARRGLAEQPARGRRGDRARRRRGRCDRPLHREGPRRRRRARRRPLPGIGRAVHRERRSDLRGRQLPGQRVDHDRR